jgi:hypothetical protein
MSVIETRLQTIELQVKDQKAAQHQMDQRLPPLKAKHARLAIKSPHS